MTQTKTMKTMTDAKLAPKPKTVASLELQPNAFQFEILDLVSKQRSNAKKEEVLVKHRNDALVSILIWNYDESIISLLPPGDVPFSDFNDMVVNSGSLKDKINSQISGNADKLTFNGIDEKYNKESTSIRQQVSQLTYFIAGKMGGNPYNLKSIKRENMFITLLQGLHPREAEILCLVKDKNLSSKYKITFDNVKNAYPDIEWGNR